MVRIVIHLPCGKLIDGVVFPCEIFDQEHRPFERPFAFRLREVLIDSCPSCIFLRDLQSIVQRLVGKRHRRRLPRTEIHREDLVALIEAERRFRLFYVIGAGDHLRVVRGAVGLCRHAADLIRAGRVAEDAEHRPGQVIAVVPVGDLRAFRGLPHLHLPCVDEGDREVRFRAVRLDDQAVDLLAAAFLDEPVGGTGSPDVHGHDVRPQELRDVRRRFQMEGIALVQVRGIYRAVLQHEAHLGGKPAVGQSFAGRYREGPGLLDIPVHHRIRGVLIKGDVDAGLHIRQCLDPRDQVADLRVLCRPVHMVEVLESCIRHREMRDDIALILRSEIARDVSRPSESVVQDLQP